MCASGACSGALSGSANRRPGSRGERRLSFAGRLGTGLRHGLLDIVEDAGARFAVEDFLRVLAAEFLIDVRADAHTAERAGFVANLGERDAVVPPRDPLVVVEQV